MYMNWRWLQIPRRALSTLRVEITDGGPLGSSMGDSDSASASACVTVVSADALPSLLLLTVTLSGFFVVLDKEDVMETENEQLLLLLQVVVVVVVVLGA